MPLLDPDDGTARAQSEALGVALLVAVAVVGGVFVAATGLAALDTDRERVGMGQAERGLSQFDARASEVALAGGDGARVDFGLPDEQGTLSTRPDEGWMRIEYTDLTGVRDPNKAVVANVSLGSVVYARGDATVGYQGGGVFRSDGNGSVLVSRPEFHYREGTLTIPVIRTRGETAVASAVRVTPNGSVRRFPDASRNLGNRIDNSTVIVTVQSRYYRGWAEYFRDYTPGIVTVDESAKTARVQFISLPDRGAVGTGVFATAESGRLALAGTGAYVDAYDSRVAPYETSRRSNGTVKTVGDVEMTGNSTIDGDVEVGESISMGGDSLVTGDVRWTVSKDLGGTVQGEVSRTDGVPTVLPIDSLVVDQVDALRQANDNAGSPVSSGGTVVTGTETLGPGEYYTEHLSVDGGTLVVDATGGNVTIGIEDWLTVRKSSSIEVQGSGTVTIYLNADDEVVENPTGEGKEVVNLFLGKDATVSVPDDRAPQLRVFGQQELRGFIGGSSGGKAAFTGILYAPDGLEQDGEIYVKQAQVYGGTVAGTVRLGQSGQVHYDEALSELDFPRAYRLSRLDYMHVVVHRLTVSSDHDDG